MRSRSFFPPLSMILALKSKPCWNIFKGAGKERKVDLWCFNKDISHYNLPWSLGCGRNDYEHIWEKLQTYCLLNGSQHVAFPTRRTPFSWPRYYLLVTFHLYSRCSRVQEHMVCFVISPPFTVLEMPLWTGPSLHLKLGGGMQNRKKWGPLQSSCNQGERVSRLLEKIPGKSFY